MPTKIATFAEGRSFRPASENEPFDRGIVLDRTAVLRQVKQGRERVGLATAELRSQHHHWRGVLGGAGQSAIALRMAWLNTDALAILRRFSRVGIKSPLLHSNGSRTAGESSGGASEPVRTQRG